MAKKSTKNEMIVIESEGPIRAPEIIVSSKPRVTFKMDSERFKLESSGGSVDFSVDIALQDVAEFFTNLFAKGNK